MLGITLSPPQAELATQRARDAGVGDLVEFRVFDYRDLSDDSFDAVASIGMVEHVGGSQADEYGRQVARVLRPGGKVLNHGISWVPATKQGFHIGGDFSDRYVFPDGEVQNLWRMIQSLERAGLETLHVENLHSDYAETLRHWATRLDENLEEAIRIAGDERVRVWRLYLRAARNGFETGPDRRLPDALLAPPHRGPERLAQGPAPRRGPPPHPRLSASARDGLARADLAEHALGDVLAGEADLLAQQRGLAVGDVAVGEADAQHAGALAARRCPRGARAPLSRSRRAARSPRS